MLWFHKISKAPTGHQFMLTLPIAWCRAKGIKMGSEVELRAEGERLIIKLVKKN